MDPAFSLGKTVDPCEWFCSALWRSPLAIPSFWLVENNLPVNINSRPRSHSRRESISKTPKILTIMDSKNRRAKDDLQVSKLPRLESDPDTNQDSLPEKTFIKGTLFH